MKKEASIKTETVTREGGMILKENEKTAVDLLIEEFGDDWPLEHVKFGFDDGGRVLQIYCEESKADEFRRACPPRYTKDRIWTVVIGVEEGYGEEL